MMSKRKILIECLEGHFIPMLLERGFVRSPVKKEEKWYLPLGKLSRKNGVEIQTIDIQFDKNGKGKFVVNLKAEQPKERTSQNCRLYQWQWKNFMKWFSDSWLFNFKGPEARALRTIENLMRSYPEIENWFASREAGPHIRYYGEYFMPGKKAGI